MPKSATHCDPLLASRRVSLPNYAPSAISSLSSGPRRSGRSLASSDASISTPSFKRRVNPESLAVRLGPELVKELEALLVPGMTEMPPFSVRQAIQQRYGINRRHIYDWFHSKGLRVTKEEKRIADVARPDISRQQLNTVFEQPSRMSLGHGDCCSNNCTLSQTHMDTINIPRTNASSDFPQGRHIPFPINPLFNPSYSLPSYQGFQMNVAPLTDYPIQENVSNFYLHLSPGKPEVSASSDQSTTQVSPTNNAIRNNLDSLLSIGDGNVLSGAERRAIYDSLSHVLGPACGIQESVGTYKAFMSHQTQLYYERLLPEPTGSVEQSSTNGRNSATTARSAVSLPPTSVVTPEIHSIYRGDFRSASRPDFDGQSHTSSLDSSCAPTPDLPSDTGVGSSKSWPGDHARYYTSSPVLKLGDILESPVLKSRNPTAEMEMLGSATHNEEWHLQEQHPNHAYILGGQTFNAPLAPVYHPMVRSHGQPWEDPTIAYWPQAPHFPAQLASVWEANRLGTTLQHDKSTWAIDRTDYDPVKCTGQVSGRTGMTTRLTSNGASLEI
ncbi:uncharacterized protein FIBRA_05907 [Fibroporia radiculosa]|uniref:Uncharacterized protein n=1 Tax=Fibroporia radiculosa TaxID=599839 RepID=J4IAZ3_9APHY|nr:uncharacterized protein FIBRA_05907 [Fibroporia radiculosa]CCM03761.1 predicted protein [Fibroporia radiculosa]